MSTPLFSLLIGPTLAAQDLSSFAWLAGTWRGEQGEVLMEETWSQPQAGNMVGMFRMLQGEEVAFYELMVIEQDEGGPVLRLQHFDAGLVGWERKKRCVSFPLRESAEGLAVFENPEEGERLRYELGEGGLQVDLSTPEGESAFSFQRVPPSADEPAAAQPGLLQGLRTAAYQAQDLQAAKAFYSQVLGEEPYFDQPFYVGYDVAGFELGLTPVEGEAAEGVTAYWRVADIDAAWQRLLELGATAHRPPQDVGDGIRVGTLQDPQGNLLGIIQQP